MFSRRFSFFFFFQFAIVFSWAQEIRVIGAFQSDSIKIGQPVPYILSATYPKDLTIVFPDSTYSFSPFEIQRKKFYPTHTQGQESIDSVIYYLTTYEIDKVQHLHLPVFVVHPADCTAVYAQMDSVFLQEMVKQVPDSVSAQQLPLKTNTTYQRVKWLLNYPFLLIIGGIILVVIIIVWLVFGKQIRKYFKLRSLQKKHQQFIARFQQANQEIEKEYSRNKVETAIVLWKKYMEQLDELPYTKFTTKEIRNLVADNELIESLRALDKMIYSGSNGNPSTIGKLRDFAEDEFEKKKEEVRNG